jgi:uncharacterized protein with LGFP repeats
LGWEGGICGYPTTDESAAGNGGRFNHFSKNNASIYWHASTGTWCVQGAIKNKWAELGWENGTLGYPTSDEYDVAGGRRSNFQGGTLTWNASTGVVTMPKSEDSKAECSGEASWLLRFAFQGIRRRRSTRHRNAMLPIR